MTPSVLITLQLTGYEVSLLIQCLNFLCRKDETSPGELMPDDRITASVILSKLKLLLTASQVQVQPR